MLNTKKRFTLLFFIICLQIVVYAVFLRPVILTWGASKNEVNTPLPGDNIASSISSTRAITVHTPAADVWKWLVQLGADRGGLYSYEIMEYLTGFYGDNSRTIVPEFQEMKVGRIVPISRSDSKIGFRVVSVDPGKSFVLEGWGSFVLKQIDSETTRLIIRTHGWEIKSISSFIFYKIIEPLHYIMERRMLIGFKARAEAGEGVRLSIIPDILWFLGVLLSYLGIILLVFMGRSIQCAVLSIFFGIIWLWPLLIFDPQNVYSVILLILIIATIIWFRLKKSHQEY